MQIDEERIAEIEECVSWPMTVSDFARMMTASRRHVLRAIVERGMVQTRKLKDGTEEPCTYGFLVDKARALEVWAWMFSHLERRAYDEGSTSRRIARQARL